MRIFVFALLISLTPSALVLVPSVLGAQQPQVMRIAPADEYFGKFKMSILGIRNQLRDMNSRLTYAPAKADDILGAAALVEDALHDWERKYPADPWLAKDVYQLTHLYARIHTGDAHRRALHGLQWLLTRYRRSPFATRAMMEVGPAWSKRTPRE